MTAIPVRDMTDIEAIETTPLAKRVPWPSTYRMIADQAARTPDKVAIAFLLSGDLYEQPQEVTYRQLLGRIHQTANLFDALGVGSDDVVSVLLPNTPYSHFVIWGAQARGIVNPINPLLEPKVIADILRAAGTKVLVALGEFPGSDIWEKVAAVRGEVPSLTRIVRVMGPSDEAAGIVGFDEAIGNHRADGFAFARTIEPGDTAALFHTGGTTGTPKLARHTHANEIYLSWVISMLADMTENDVLLCGLPLFHVNGVFVTGLAPFSRGAKVVMLSPRGYRDPSVAKNFFKIVDHYKATFFSAVPTFYAALMQVPLEGADVSSLRYAICGAAPMPVELFRGFEKKFGMKILEGYGLTEGTCASSINPRDGERKIGSIGLRFPYQPMKTAILGDDGKFVRDCAPDEIGAVLVRGPNVFPGYVDPAHNKAIWADAGWLNTGDLGRRDADGYFWLTGRKKELIIRGGHNIDPALIEEPLVRIPGVNLAAAVGRPDPYAGEVPVAYVQLDPGVTLTGAQILELVKDKIGERAAVPKEIVVLDALPVTAVGKIFKPKLRWDAIRRAFEKELAALSDVVESATVEVGEDKTHGTAATITVKPKAGQAREAIEKRVHAALTNYTVRYTLAF
jgi:fatty-acyl-CoA synthase